jgi:diguanylate cyclase
VELLTRLRAALQRGGSLGLVLVNFDDLTALQTRIGFDASAALLHEVARRVRHALSGRATLLRFGDACLCVLIPGVRNAGHAVLAANKLMHEIDEAMVEASLAITPPVHIGIGLHPHHAADAEALLRQAQLAAAAARALNPPLQVYDENCAQQVLEPWSLADAYVEALRSGSLEVHYQPKLRVADGAAAGAEALLRWLRDGQPVSTPDVFIPLAERSGLIQETTWYVLSNALQKPCEQMRLPVAVNITPHMLHHRDFMEMIRSAVATWNVPAGSLTLEITEGALIVDFEEAIARLQQLREIGVRIAIDDFGTGYSSLTYFKKVPADEIKIDKSFVLHMAETPADRHIVRAIIDLSHQFELAVVAEGVENQVTLDALAGMRCDYAQGYLVSPALSLAKLQDWLYAMRR